MRVFSTQSCLTAMLLASTCGLVSPALALDTVLENITIKEKDDTRLVISRVEVTGTNLTKEELTKLFSDTTSAEDLRAIAGKMKADKVAIPEVVVTKKNAKVTISKIFATNIADGKIEHAGIASIDSSNPDETGGMATVKAGAITLDGSNMSALLGTASGSLSFTHLGVQDISIVAPDKDTPATAVGGNMFSIKLGTLSVDSRFDGNVLLNGAVSLTKFTLQPHAG
ncbi:MAG: hypothetical protein JWL62_1514 [Hyphomicrobiales bacterium]|nr:hypothetical protein [Hyphomicrobiales bacterium]